MKQVLQNVRTGEMRIAELPCPQAAPGSVLIRTRASLISAGTERMLVEFSRANLLQKARQKPEQVKLVLDMMRTNGILPTLEAVFNKLDEPLPLGYCNSGVVMDVGPGIHDIRKGDRVASNGPHAEIVCVPRNLCAKIPDSVTDEQAAFTVLASIALQGLRLAQPQLGEKFVVFGLGLVGLLTVQFLRANGCEVLGVDLNPERLKLAERFGARTVDLKAGADPGAAAEAWTNGKGVDGAIIAASAKTNAIVHQAATACRKRGRIILVGVVGLDLQRADFYEKELTFQVSCSYGPGRYDETYEQGGRDYPYGLVRFTEQRNFETVLDAIGGGALHVDDLITDRVIIADAVSAYEKLSDDPHALGVLLEYPGEPDRAPVIATARAPEAAAAAAGQAVVGVIGAGNFANTTLLPALSKTPARLVFVADLNAAAAEHAAAKYRFEKATTDHKALLNDPAVNTVFVVVGHHLHACFVQEALAAGKHVYVEKPLCLTEQELTEIEATYNSQLTTRNLQLGGNNAQPEGTSSALPVPDSAIRNPQSAILLMVGFNRRFSPHTAKMKDLLASRSGPLCMTMTVNAGELPPTHWTQDPERGGGRILGEGCHFIDLLAFLAGAPVTTVSAAMAGEGPAVREDKMSIVLTFADGSLGTVNYFANGAKSYPKEMLQVFSDNRVLTMQNFRRTRGYGFTGFKTFRTPRQDKGHNAEIAAFIDRIAAGGGPLIPFDELVNTTRASFAAVASARERRTIEF